MSAEPAQYTDKEFRCLVQRLRARAETLRAERARRRQRRMPARSVAPLALLICTAIASMVAYGWIRPLGAVWARVSPAAATFPALPATPRRIAQGLLQLSMVPTAPPRAAPAALQLHLGGPQPSQCGDRAGEGRTDGPGLVPRRPMLAHHVRWADNGTSSPALHVRRILDVCAATPWEGEAGPVNRTTEQDCASPLSDPAATARQGAGTGVGTVATLAIAIVAATLMAAAQALSLWPCSAQSTLIGSASTCHTAAPPQCDSVGGAEAVAAPARRVVQEAPVPAEPIAEVLEVSSKMLEDPGMSPGLRPHATYSGHSTFLPPSGTPLCGVALSRPPRLGAVVCKARGPHSAGRCTQHGA